MHTTHEGSARRGLILASLGVVFGDIGTSPLYSLQTLFSEDHHAIAPTATNVLGLISLVLWLITIIVTVKYVFFILRADHHGEGGILALATMARLTLTRRPRVARLIIPAGIIGACLFIGDSIITPAISVLSAVEGLSVAEPSLSHLIVPIAVAILLALFLVQRWGTGRIGGLFGPVMAVWFLTLAALGVPHIIRNPQVFKAVSPTYAAEFFIHNPAQALLALGAVVLVVTGAEALYADLGHFGRKPITLAWMAIVFPALAINYLGQGAMLLGNPGNISNPFFYLSPARFTFALTILATLATIIASQAVISGTFSVVKQAMRLGYLPHLRIRNTSEHESGQIYIPVANTILLIGVLIVVIVFRSSAALANAYGMAVSTTFLVTTSLYLLYVHRARRWPLVAIIALGGCLGIVEIAIFIAASAKFVHGGWLPVLLAVIIALIMLTWHWGMGIVTRKRRKAEGTLRELLDEIYETQPQRVPGTVIYPHSGQTTAPLALKRNLRLNGVLQEHVLIVKVTVTNVPHISPKDRVRVQEPAAPIPGILLMNIRYGFFDRINVPLALSAWSYAHEAKDIDIPRATYVLTNLEYRALPAPPIRWLKTMFFIALSHASASPSRHFKLPRERTLEISQEMGI